MEILAGRIAAVTGAASGIGLALARAFAAEGMHVALADVDEAGLQRAVHAVEGAGVRALAVRTDVGSAEDVDAFARAILRHFGGIHLVCNNAGVCPVGLAWETSLDDWRWAVDVNLWGAIHGVRTFTPMLLAQDEGHIVNTASVAGLIAPGGFGAYSLTKHGVVALSEVVHHDLGECGSRVGVSVLCPAYVPTDLAAAVSRHGQEHARQPKSPATLAKEALLHGAVAAGKLSADDIARSVVEAVVGNRFYVLPHARVEKAVKARLEDILQRRAPRDPMRL